MGACTGELTRTHTRTRLQGLTRLCCAVREPARSGDWHHNFNPGPGGWVSVGVCVRCACHCVRAYVHIIASPQAHPPAHTAALAHLRPLALTPAPRPTLSPALPRTATCPCLAAPHLEPTRPPTTTPRHLPMPPPCTHLQSRAYPCVRVAVHATAFRSPSARARAHSTPDALTPTPTPHTRAHRGAVSLRQ